MTQPLPHHPPHVFIDDTWYMITASTNASQHFMKSDASKSIVRDALKSLVIEFHVQLAVWVILDNHYHILLKSKEGNRISRLIARLHGRVSHELNTLDATRHRRVWDNYWDTCIRTEADYWTRFNYIHHNPVKHGYASRMDEWPFSSYAYYLRVKCEEWLADAFRLYPIVDFTQQDDD